MNLIALLTDFGTKDGFVGSMKGVIKTINPTVDIVDITHEISSFSILEGALVLYSTYKYFPKHSIFVCVVDPGVGTERKAIVVKTLNYFFILPDNGLITLVSREENIQDVFLIENERFLLKRVSETFHGRDIFSPVAAYISRGIELSLLGKRIDKEELTYIDIPEPQIKENKIIGEILTFDKFGNAITNIRNIFPNRVRIKFRDKTINGVVRNFMEGEKDKPNAIIGSTGFLELFLPMGNFKEKFRAKSGEKVEIEWEE